MAIIFGRFIRLIFFLITFTFSFVLQANSLQVLSYDLPKIHPQVENLLKSDVEPEGVVFDIETLDSKGLVSLTQYVTSQVELVKQAFPSVDIAIVSHGAEEFALQTTASDKYADVHNLFSELVSTKEVSVHVCGAVGSLKNLTQEDFPEFVSYSASGLAQINVYKAIGYTVIVIKELTDKQRKALFNQPKDYIK